MIHVIMYLNFYISIKFAIAIGTNNMFAVYFVCLVPHIHLAQTSVLKQCKVTLGSTQTI